MNALSDGITTLSVLKISMIYDYENHVRKYSDSYERIILPDSKVTQVKEFVREVLKKKNREQHHKIDNNFEYARWLNGFLGECAVEQYLSQPFVDFTVGNSVDYHVSDLSKLGYQCGVKTSAKYRYPVIFKQSYKPEIIVVKQTEKLLWICGLATPNILNTFQSLELITDHLILKRGKKTAFYGFHQLINPKKMKKYLHHYTKSI